MEEGLKVILSADVTQFQEAFARATQTTKQSVTAINSTLSSTGKAAETAAKTWREFVGERMGQYMKQFGSHGAAIRQISAEWAIYKQSVQDAGKAGAGIGQTAAAIQQVAGAMNNLKGVEIPSTAPLVNGLNAAEAAVTKFAQGAVSVRELNRAISQLITTRAGLNDTAAIDTLIAKLQALAASGRGMKSIGLDINPNVDVAGTLKDIEQVKALIAGQDFRFTLTADGKQLQGEMVRSVESTRAAVAQINEALKGAGTGFAQMTEKAKLSVAEYVRALGQLNNVPTAVKTTVQAPDMTPVLNAVRQVKSEISTATVAALPKLTLTADTSQFRQNILQTKAVTEEAWATMRQTFNGVDKAIADAAAKSRVSVQQLIQNFNGLKGITPNSVSFAVAPANFAPVVAAARKARKDIDNAFLTPLPPIKMPAGAAQTFNALGKGSNEAQQALINLSRVAQDAPYGFIGIANNINPLLESFQRLKASTGSTSLALKAMGASLMGPAGIGLAVGLASSLLVVFGDRLFKTKDKAEKMREELQKAKDASEAFVESLDLISKTRLKGEMNAQKELVSLRMLYEATQNQNLAYSERKKAVDALQQQYPTYFKNIQDEAILAGRAQEAYQKLTLAIVAAAKARAAQSELDTLAQEERRLLKQQEETARQEESAAKRVLQARKEAKENPTPIITGGISQSGATSQVTAMDKVWFAQYDYAAAIKGTAKSIAELNVNQERQKQIAGEIKTLTEQFGVDVLIDTKEGANKEKVKRTTDDAFKKLADYVKGINLEAQVDFNATPVVKEPTNWLEQWRESLKQQFEKQIDTSVTLNFTPEQIKANALTSEVDKVFTDMMEQYREADIEFPKIDLESFVKEGGAEALLTYLTNILKTTKDFREQMQDIMGDAAVDSITGFAEGFGEALSTGDFSKPFVNVLNVMGSAIQELGKQLIMGSQIIQAFKKSLATLVANPAGALAVGMAMVGVGAAIKAASSKMTKFADGGIVFGPTVGLMGEYAGASSNPEVIAPLSKLKDMLRGAGGATSVNVNGSWEVAGDKLRLVLARSNRKSGRYI